MAAALGRHLGHHRDRLALLALGVFILLVVSPVGNFPLDDDWWYARPVQRLVSTGTLQLIPGTGPSLVAQVAWGAVFVQVFGFSHTVLRASTLVLAMLGVLAFHDLAHRALGRRVGLLLAALLMVNPLFVTTAYSFRTDVPFLAVALLALAAATRGLDQPTSADGTGRPTPRLGWLVAAGLLAATGYLIRQFGVVVPPAILAAIWVACGWRVALSPRILLAVAGPMLLAVGGWQVWRHANVEVVATGELEVVEYIIEHRGFELVSRFLTWFRPTLVHIGLIGLPLSAAFLLCGARLAGRTRIGVVLGGLVAWWALVAGWAGDWSRGMYLLPLGLAILAPWPARRLLDVPLRAGLLVVAVALAADAAPSLTNARSIVPPPMLGYTLTPSGFQTNTMFWRDPPPPLVGDTLRVAVSALGLVGVPLLLVAATRVVGRGVGHPAARHPATVGTLAFGVLVLAEVLLLSIYRGVQDRYLLALVPSTLLLGAVAAPRARALIPLGVASAMLLGAWSLSWEREYLARQGAIWTAAEALVAQGARARYVDGGYEWNGWHRELVAVERGRQWAARRRSSGAFLNGFYEELSRSDMPWYVDFRPDPGATCPDHVVATVPYSVPDGDGRLMYGLKRCR